MTKSPNPSGTTAGPALPPGAVIGILGGGQLGRMAAMAAASLGYRCHIYCPEADPPAAEVSAFFTQAAYDDEEALTRFAEGVDVVTYEFENITLVGVEFLAQKVTLRPNTKALRICQNRVREKTFCREVGVPTADFAALNRADELPDAFARISAPALLKTVEMGYDGKGQARLSADSDLAEAWNIACGHAGQNSCILEAFVDFACEVSVIVARSQDGALRSFPVVENEHRDQILYRTTAPASVAPELAQEAQDIAEKLAAAMDLIGLLAVEMFVTRDNRVLVNEMAPRPHNSGHWTIDACITSQFEQFIRAVAGLPLGDPSPLCPAVMTNLLGPEALEAQGYLAEDPCAKLHLYGKREAKPGRKMGHVTQLKPTKT
jgi:5-(carboxyamino)imidazole ribonucleotide synthase